MPATEPMIQVAQAESALIATLVTRGRWVRHAQIADEEWLEGESDPEAILRLLKDRGGADLFSFMRPLPYAEVCYPYYREQQNVAVADTTDFNSWWESLPQESRKNVRRSQRRGVVVRLAEFDDQMVDGIRQIYNETPIRQGRRFPHYGKPIDRVRAENSTYPDRSTFIGAYFEDTLIGFIKFVRVNSLANIMQIVALEAHSDKRPTNALLAKAVEVCAERKLSHLVYGRYIYGNKTGSPVTEFKKRNGFSQLTYPRYYIPLSTRGQLALKLGLHREILNLLPEGVTNLYLRTRATFYRRFVANGNGSFAGFAKVTNDSQT